MKKIIIDYVKCLCLIVFLMAQTACFAADPAPPNIVIQFYDTMVRLSNATSDADAFDCRERLKDCFRGKEASGIPVPNDFYDWGYVTDGKTTANQYANTFYDLFYQRHKLKMLGKYKVIKSSYVSEVDLKRYRNQSSGLIQTVVTKTFTDGKMNKTFSDTLIVERNEIVIFKNSSFTGDDGEDIESLRALAASYYTSKRYYSAYRIYEKILRIDPDNANAYYRLGLMTFWRQGCWFSLKEAHRRGREYVEKSHNLGFYKAKTAIYYMNHPQSI